MSAAGLSWSTVVLPGASSGSSAPVVIDGQFLIPSTSEASACWSADGSIWTQIDTPVASTVAFAGDGAGQIVAFDGAATTTAYSAPIWGGAGSAEDPVVHTGHIVRYRIKGTSAIIVSLLQGAATIKSWTHDPAPSEYTTFAQTLAEADAAGITNYADLRIKFEAS